MPGCEAMTPSPAIFAKLDNEFELNRLQAQVAQQQEALRQRDQDTQSKQLLIDELDTRCRQMTFDLRQAHLFSAGVERQLHRAQTQRAELHDFHEANRVDSERRLFESWQTVHNLADVIKGLRDLLDGPRLAEEERAIDVKAMIVEKETSRVEVGGLRNLLLEANSKAANAADHLSTVQQKASLYHTQLRAKDQKLAALERSCTFNGHDLRRFQRQTPKKAVDRS